MYCNYTLKFYVKQEAVEKKSLGIVAIHSLCLGVLTITANFRL